MKIEPTIGRIVWYYNFRNPIDQADQPLAAIVTYVHADKQHINLAVFHHTGEPYAIRRVPLIQHGDPTPDSAECDGYCTWMPYQIGQAQKLEQLQSMGMPLGSDGRPGNATAESTESNGFVPSPDWDNDHLENDVDQSENDD